MIAMGWKIGGEGRKAPCNQDLNRSVINNSRIDLSPEAIIPPNPQIKPFQNNYLTLLFYRFNVNRLAAKTGAQLHQKNPLSI